MEPQRKERRLSINYEVPLSYLLGISASIVSALLYAGWNAQSLMRKLDDAVELGKKNIVSQENTNNQISILTIHAKVIDAEVEQLKRRADRLEQRK